jgi:dynein heavy chain, axonemal
MSQDLEKIYFAFLDNQIPNSWNKYSYLSLKPLASWLIDFGKRLEFFKNWALRQRMPSYLISALYFPQVYKIYKFYLNRDF